MLKRLLKNLLFALAALAFVVFWALAFSGKLPLPSQQHSGDKQPAAKSEESNPLADGWYWLTKDSISFFTFVLALFTGCLVWVAVRTDKTARVTQRAYLTVKPRGIEPFSSGDGRVACHVSIYNAGNLPATNVSWTIQRGLFETRSVTEFPITEKQEGDIVIAPGDDVRKNCLPYTEDELNEFSSHGFSNDRWWFIWGRIEYRDGFRHERFTNFCHRYNINGRVNLDSSLGSWSIDGKHGRYHEHGNSTDES